MSKSRDTKKDMKKKPAQSPKEKRKAKKGKDRLRFREPVQAIVEE